MALETALQKWATGSRKLSISAQDQMVCDFRVKNITAFRSRSVQSVEDCQQGQISPSVSDERSNIYEYALLWLSTTLWRLNWLQWNVTRDT